MSSRSFLGLLVTVVATSACGLEEGPQSSPASPSYSCPPIATGDVICRKHRAVHITLPGESRTLVTGDPSQWDLPAGTFVELNDVDGSSGVADIGLGDSGLIRAACQFTQETLEKKGELTTRSPEGALFHQTKGISFCTVAGSAVTKICEAATIETKLSLSQYKTVCNPDPVLVVAVAMGEAAVLYEGEVFLVRADEQFTAFPEPRIEPFAFSEEDLEVFREQAQFVPPAEEPEG